MFNLEDAIVKWKKNLRSSRNMEESDVAELESHVRDETARYIEEGLDAEAAFRKAVGDPATTEALEAEYGKVRRLMPALAWTHLKIAWRKMRSQKAYSFINIVGLAFGMACSILIYYWVRDELGYNRFHENAGRIVRINKTYQIGTGTDFNSSTPWPLAGAVREGFPEVQDATGFATVPAVVRFGNKVFNERRVCVVDPSFFRVFTFPFVKGVPDSALPKPDSIVVTESVAAKYFGAEEPVGKTLNVDQDKDFVVTGVVSDIPSNSDIRYDLFVPASGFVAKEEMEEWENHMATTFALLRPGADRGELAKKLSGLIQGRLPKEKIALVLQPLGDIHLYSADGSEEGMRFVRIFSAIAAFILAIACINCINLSTACSEKRAKEVGMRKVVGGRRAQIAWQFFGESVLFTSIGFVIALGLVQSLRGVFHDLTGKVLDWGRFGPGFIAGLILIAVFTGLLSGVYPAIVLSSFKPARVFRDATGRRGRKASFQKT
ncbi:MAG: ABC transporter permease, partial [Candidatus Aminicenantes bacterium]|nr:ABC transporter permease [Candidatus Aminicenantes bacterium]